MNGKWSELERLTRLRSEGALTAEEFEAEKLRLLKRLPTWRIWLLLGSLAVLLVTVGLALWRVAEPSLPFSGQSVAGDAAPLTLQGAFDLAFPASKRLIKIGETTVAVRFRPSSLYTLGSDRMVLLSKGENLENDDPASVGFYAITYLKMAPRPVVDGQSFIGTGSNGGRGLSPELTVLPDLLDRPVVQVTSRATGPRGATTTADLVWLGSTVAELRVIARGIAIAFDDAGSGDKCAIRGQLVENGPHSFKAIYSGSYVGEAIYQQGPGGFDVATAGGLYERCPPA